MVEPFGLVFVLLLFVVGLPLLLLPTIIAVTRGHRFWFAILLLNIFGGLLFGVGWLLALIWAFIDDVPARSTRDVASQLEKLHALKEKGALTEREYEREKRRLLG